MRGMVIVIVAVLAGSMIGQWDKWSGLAVILLLGSLGLVVAWQELS